VEDTDYALGRTSVEYGRLVEQAELLAPLTERLFRAAGVGSGMRVLDVGCGVGDVSFLASSLVGADGIVVGVDLDSEALNVAERRRATGGITNVEFRNGDARTFDVEHPFDAAVGRLVLMYMRDPAAALRQIAERVAPGGILAFHEWDARVSPAAAMNQPVLAELQRLIALTFQRSGASLEIGAQLYQCMRAADLEPERRPLAEIAVHMTQDEVAYRRWAQFVPSLLPKMVEYGLATEDQLLDLIEHRLRDELIGAPGPMSLSWLMIGQWARKHERID
jgi:ubiquinone/menaquinone biosynthesis C-methylase UbiE